MYAWIWRNLPGPVPVRVLISLALVVVVVALLFAVVFPWAEQALPFLHVTVNSQ
jgi:hypothetical protein